MESTKIINFNYAWSHHVLIKMTKERLKCSKCKRAVHFTCKKLPLYQLRLFFTKSYRAYVCVNCVTMPKEFQKLCKN